MAMQELDSYDKRLREIAAYEGMTGIKKDQGVDIIRRIEIAKKPQSEIENTKDRPITK